jgi:hypothetical protein
MKSPKNSFKNTSEKLIRSLFLAMLMALSTWLLSVPELIDLGVYAPVGGALITFAVNAIRVYIKELES